MKRVHAATRLRHRIENPDRNRCIIVEVDEHVGPVVDAGRRYKILREIRYWGHNEVCLPHYALGGVSSCWLALYAGVGRTGIVAAIRRRTGVRHKRSVQRDG